MIQCRLKQKEPETFSTMEFSVYTEETIMKADKNIFKTVQ